jgi:hypothetical protein
MAKYKCIRSFELSGVRGFRYGQTYALEEPLTALLRGAGGPKDPEGCMKFFRPEGGEAPAKSAPAGRGKAPPAGGTPPAAGTPPAGGTPAAGGTPPEGETPATAGGTPPAGETPAAAGKTPAAGAQAETAVEEKINRLRARARELKIKLHGGESIARLQSLISQVEKELEEQAQARARARSPAGAA